MSLYDCLAIGLLVLAIGVNSVSVYLQKSRHIYKRFGSNALKVHSAIISFFWLLFIGSEFLVSRSSWSQTAYPILGLTIMAVALIIFVAAFRQVGLQGLGNGNFFGHATRRLKGIYRFMPEPMYLSYVIWFMGLGMLTGQKAFFLIALVAFVGLFFVEAQIERVS